MNSLSVILLLYAKQHRDPVQYAAAVVVAGICACLFFFLSFFHLVVLFLV